MEKVVSTDGQWYYIREIARDATPREGGWLSLSGEAWVLFTEMHVGLVTVSEAMPEEIARYGARLPEALRLAVTKDYWIETEKGGYAEPYTRFEAIKLARQESGDYSNVIFVRHERAYTPDVIFYCGREYRPVEPESSDEL